MQLDDSDNLEYTFVSGAFNSHSSGKRERGAELSADLITDVIEETAILGKRKPLTDSGSSPIFETPTKKRVRLYATNTNILFAPSSSVNVQAEKAKEEQPLSLSSLLNP